MVKMKGCALFLTAYLIAFSACSSSDQSGQAESPNNFVNGEAVAINANSSSSNVPESDMANTVPGSVANRRERHLNRPKLPASGPPPPMTFRKAPEGSEFGATMLEDGSIREVRIFKKHPTLASVESVAKATGNRNVKFVYKNGRVIELQTDQITDLYRTPASKLVEIAATGTAAGQ